MLFEVDFHILSNLVRFYKTLKNAEIIQFMCNFFSFLVSLTFLITVYFEQARVNQ